MKEIILKCTGNIFLIKKNYISLLRNEKVTVKIMLQVLFSKIHYKLYTFLFPKKPWLTPASNLFFDRFLNKNMIGLEYGSGRSTLYFAKKLKKLYSIEHHREWYNKISQLLNKRNISNVDYLFVTHDSNLDYSNYYQKVNEFPDSYFDFIIIDGRSRVNCGLNSLKKLKVGGILVLDDSQREKYNILIDKLNDWPSVITTNGQKDTTIFIKKH